MPGFFIKSLENGRIIDAIQCIKQMHAEGRKTKQIIFQLGGNDLRSCGIGTIIHLYMRLIATTKSIWPDSNIFICGVPRMFGVSEDKRFDCNTELKHIKGTKFIAISLTRAMMEVNGVHPNAAGTRHLTEVMMRSVDPTKRSDPTVPADHKDRTMPRLYHSTPPPYMFALKNSCRVFETLV